MDKKYIVDKFKNILKFLIKILAFSIIFGSCSYIAFFCMKEDQNISYYKSVIKNGCFVELNMAGKSLNLNDFKSHLDKGINCLENNKSTCTKDMRPFLIESENDFDDKIKILKSLSNESLHVNELNSEMLIQKYNRIVFDGGYSCYKGKCLYKQSIFICNYNY